MAVAIAILLNANFSDRLLADPIPMNTKQQILDLVNRQAKAWENADAQAIAADFAEDAIFIAPGSEFNGKQQVQKAAQDYFKQFTDTQVRIKRIIIDGDRGAVEWAWSDRNRQTDKPSYAEDAIIFELENSKIVYWREYIEKKEIPIDN
jgi:uncharacterized protein (TIGR02246 family)